jgi:benzoyl-CoA reductase/2-hydroxyglutaryl-CoA dehydratase subunit BcrC/BadD/HgdB
MAREVEEKYKLPVLVLEVDHTDPNYFHDAQVETRIKALLETIKK